MCLGFKSKNELLDKQQDLERSLSQQAQTTTLLVRDDAVLPPGILGTPVWVQNLYFEKSVLFIRKTIVLKICLNHWQIILVIALATRSASFLPYIYPGPICRFCYLKCLCLLYWRALLVSYFQFINCISWQKLLSLS